MIDDLMKRLRSNTPNMALGHASMREAANHIEALVAEAARLDAGWHDANKRVRDELARANAATAAAYEVAARRVEREGHSLGDEIRALATPDQTAALDKLIAGAVGPYVEANGILEDALQEVGDDYPGSNCQSWCQQQVKEARAILAASKKGGV